MDHILQIVQFRCIVIFIIGKWATIYFGREWISILQENRFYDTIDDVFDQLCYPRLS